MTVPAETLWLLCDDNAASTTVLDASGNGYNGTLAGGNNTQDISVAGKVGTALQLDGSADYISLGDLAALEFGTADAFTVMAWVKPNGADENGYIISKYNGTTGWGVYWRGDANLLRFYYDAWTNKASQDVFVDTGVWVHIAAVFSAGSVTWYRNGVQLDTDSGITITSPTPHNAVVGCNSLTPSASSLFDGAIDDVRVYSAACTPEQVAAVYNSGNGTASSLAQLFPAFKPAWANHCNQLLGA